MNLKLERQFPRIVCDPIIYFNRAQNLCRNRRETDPNFDFHLLMRAKRKTDPKFKTIIDEPNFCAGRHEYVLFGNNLWFKAAWTPER